MAGAEPSRTVDFFISKQNEFTLIQGNTDLMIANYTDELYDELKSKAPIMAEALKNDFEVLNPIQKTFLKNLPIQLEVEEDGLKILLVHGSPRKNNEDILPDIDLNELEKMLENVEASIVLCGHTHIPCGFQTASKKTVVNVGSVGRPFTPEPKSCYLKMTIENGQALFEHRFVDYDKQKASEKLAKRNFKGADKLASMLLDPKVRHF
jgi:predicted phosphodiesterase